MWNIHRKLEKYNKKAKHKYFNYFPFLFTPGVVLAALAGVSLCNIIFIKSENVINYLTIFLKLFNYMLVTYNFNFDKYLSEVVVE